MSKKRFVLSFSSTVWAAFILALHGAVLYDVQSYRHDGTLVVFARPWKDVFVLLVAVALIAAVSEWIHVRWMARLRGEAVPQPTPLDLPRGATEIAKGWVCHTLIFTLAVGLVEAVIIGLTSRPFFLKMMGPLGWLATVAILVAYLTAWMHLSVALKRGLIMIWQMLRGAERTASTGLPPRHGAHLP